MKIESGLRGAISNAIQAAEIGYSMTLVRLVDDISTYAVKYSDGQYLEFCDDDDDNYNAQDRAYEHIGNRKRDAKADAVISVLKDFGYVG